MHKDVAPADKKVLLAMTDSSYDEMALNFYLTSLKPLQIDNYLFLGADWAACQLLLRHGVACFVYSTNVNKTSSSTYGTIAFNRKVNIKLNMILLALELEYHTISTDVDVFMMKNPFGYFNKSKYSDMELSWDESEYNSGFLFVRPSLASRLLYRIAIAIMIDNRESFSDQHALNIAIRGLRSLRINHMWLVDRDGYYSSPTALYLVYENNLHISSEGTTEWNIQKDALSNALRISMILNRTLILPTFTFRMRASPMNSLFRIDRMDAAFGDRYREHTFLTHYMVPASVNASLSKSLLIKTDRTGLAQKTCITRHFGRGLAETFTPANKTSGATSREIRQWFAKRTESVLRFGCLYGVFDGFVSEDTSLGLYVNKLLKEGLVYANYNQK